MDQKNLRQDNAGVSLIEIIAAVSIFVILAIVLARGFVFSARINGKTTRYQEAMNVAQNIMEDIQSKRFKNVALAFNYPNNVMTGGYRFGFLEEQRNTVKLKELGVLNDADGEVNARKYYALRRYEESNGGKITASIHSSSKGKYYSFVPKSDGKYYFSMEKITEQKNYYDALISFDGGKESEYRKKTDATKEEKNDYLMPNIATLDDKKNAILILNKDWGKSALDTLIAKWEAAHPDVGTGDSDEGTGDSDAGGSGEEAGTPQASLNWDEVYAQTKRIVEFKVVSEVGVTRVEARYIINAHDYQDPNDSSKTMKDCPCGGDYRGKTEANPNCYCTYISPWQTIFSTEVHEYLRGVYLFYYPNYHSTDENHPLDQVFLNNQAGASFHFYVTKQRDNDTTDLHEQNYKMSVEVKETASDPSWSSKWNVYRSKVSLRSNVNYNITKESVNSGDLKQRPSLNQMKLTYASGNESVNGQAAKAVLNLNALEAEKAHDRIYKMSISVYKHGAAQNGFPEEDKIYTLKGTKEN